MIAHSGFSRGLLTKADHSAASGVPAGVDDWLAKQCHPITDQEKAWAKAANAWHGKLLGHSLGVPLPGFSDPGHAPAPAAPATHSVPLSLHLNHLELTAKAERTFGYRLGFLAGFVVTALVECALKYSHLFQ